MWVEDLGGLLLECVLFKGQEGMRERRRKTRRMRTTRKAITCPEEVVLLPFFGTDLPWRCSASSKTCLA
jgi:hypothetical protein